MTSNKISEAAFTMSTSALSLAGELGLDLQQPTNALLESIINKANASARLIVEVGLELMALKQHCQHGEYQQLIERIGFTKQRAHEFTRYAEFTSSLTKAERNKVISLPKKKVLLLASAEKEMVVELLENDEVFDDIDKMPVRDLKAHLRRERLAREKAENRFIALQKAQQKAQALAAFDDDEQWHEVTRTIRRDADALAEQASLAADGIEQLLGIAGDPRHALDAANQNAAITTIYHQARAPFAKLWRLLDEMQRSFGDVIAMEDSALPLFSEEEAAQALATRSLLLGEHRAKANARADKNAPTPRKRGRKPKAQ